ELVFAELLELFERRGGHGGTSCASLRRRMRTPRSDGVDARQYVHCTMNCQEDCCAATKRRRPSPPRPGVNFINLLSKFAVWQGAPRGSRFACPIKGLLHKVDKTRPTR